MGLNSTVLIVWISFKLFIGLNSLTQSVSDLTKLYILLKLTVVSFLQNIL
jgi:hypothetical protein